MHCCNASTAHPNASSNLVGDAARCRCTPSLPCSLSACHHQPLNPKPRTVGPYVDRLRIFPVYSRHCRRLNAWLLSGFGGYCDTVAVTVTHSAGAGRSPSLAAGAALSLNGNMLNLTLRAVTHDESRFTSRIKAICPRTTGLRPARAASFPVPRRCRGWVYRARDLFDLSLAA